MINLYNRNFLFELTWDCTTTTIHGVYSKFGKLGYRELKYLSHRELKHLGHRGLKCRDHKGFKCLGHRRFKYLGHEVKLYYTGSISATDLSSLLVSY